MSTKAKKIKLPETKLPKTDLEKSLKIIDNFDEPLKPRKSKHCLKTGDIFWKLIPIHADNIDASEFSEINPHIKFADFSSNFHSSELRYSKKEFKYNYRIKILTQKECEDYTLQIPYQLKEPIQPWLEKFIISTNKEVSLIDKDIHFRSLIYGRIGLIAI